MNKLRKYSPVEVTTHNLYFHDEASIFTMDANDNFIATGGGDKDIRLWTMDKNAPKDREFCYTTAINTSVRIKYHAVLSGHNRVVNCVRFCGDLLASCSDGGEIIIWRDCIPSVIRRLDGDDAYELAWGDGHLFAAFSSGNITVFRITQGDANHAYGPGGLYMQINPDVTDSKSSEKLYTAENREDLKISAVIVQQIKCHNDIIQGLTFNHHFNLLTSLGKDRVGKTFVFTDKLVEVEHMEHLGKDRLFTAGRGFFRRLAYSSDGSFLYLVCCNLNTVVVLHYPFRMEHVYARIGPLNSEPLKVICDGERLFIVTKKSLYLFISQEFIFCVDNASFMTITDGCVFDGVCFLSSLDGFLASLRLKEQS